MISSIIDVPRQHDQNDLFGINVYQDALIDFVKHTDTPITIALQGEWGSGKTSLMNLLRWNLCDDEGAPFYPIWINTWQYSLMKSPNQAIMSILDGIINQIGALNPSDRGAERNPHPYPHRCLGPTDSPPGTSLRLAPHTFRSKHAPCWHLLCHHHPRWLHYHHQTR